MNFLYCSQFVQISRMDYIKKSFTSLNKHITIKNRKINIVYYYLTSSNDDFKIFKIININIKT